jgi:hypothetical protein
MAYRLPRLDLVNILFTEQSEIAILCDPVIFDDIVDCSAGSRIFIQHSQD